MSLTSSDQPISSMQRPYLWGVEQWKRIPEATKGPESLVLRILKVALRILIAVIPGTLAVLVGVIPYKIALSKKNSGSPEAKEKCHIIVAARGGLSDKSKLDTLKLIGHVFEKSKIPRDCSYFTFDPDKVEEGVSPFTLHGTDKEVTREAVGDAHTVVYATRVPMGRLAADFQSLEGPFSGSPPFESSANRRVYTVVRQCWYPGLLDKLKISFGFKPLYYSVDTRKRGVASHPLMSVSSYRMEQSLKECLSIVEKNI